ncbi:hypothetical protein ACTXT7_002634 [Hymenolepis weldensis]
MTILGNIYQIHLNQGENKAKDPLDFALNGNHDEMTVQRQLSSGGVTFSVLVCEVRGHGFDVTRCTSSEQNGQPHLFRLADRDSGRIGVSWQGGFITLLFCSR